MLLRMICSVVLIPGLLIGIGCSKSRTGGTAAVSVGAPVTVRDAVSIADLSARTESYVGQVVRLEGTVSGVCQGSGCWAEVRAEDGAVFLARSMDHSVLLPTDCLGRRIVVQGVVTELEAVEESEEAADHHHHGDEGEDHVCPRPTFIVSTTGAQLR